MVDVKTKLAALGWDLPQPSKPVACYVPVVQTGNLLLVSGQLPMRDGNLIATGAVPSAVSVEQAVNAAAQCAVNALSAIGVHLDDDFSRIKQIVRLGVYVKSDNDFGGQPTVANGASELLVKIFDQAGRHARAAVGVNALPLNACVELELIVEIS